MPAIRSIRVAEALTERFGVVSRPQTYARMDELQNALGEARQLYPEIWTNLDHARAMLLQRGVDLAAYDVVRNSDVARAGGVLDVTGTDGVSGEIANLLGRSDKKAYMNARGHAAAIEACRLLRDALPQVDWEALDRAEAAELAAAGSLGRPRWQRILVRAIALAIGAILVLAYIYARAGLR